MITIGTTPGATRFITGTTTIEAKTRAAELTATAARIVPAATKRVGHPARTPASEAANPTVPAHPALSISPARRSLSIGLFGAPAVFSGTPFTKQALKRSPARNESVCPAICSPDSKEPACAWHDDVIDFFNSSPWPVAWPPVGAAQGALC